MHRPPVPLSPAASIRRPAKSPGGFLKKLPALGKPWGLALLATIAQGPHGDFDLGPRTRRQTQVARDDHFRPRQGRAAIDKAALGRRAMHQRTVGATLSTAVVTSLNSPRYVPAFITRPPPIELGTPPKNSTPPRSLRVACDSSLPVVTPAST